MAKTKPKIASPVAKKNASAVSAPIDFYYGSASGPELPVPPWLAIGVKALEQKLGMPVVMLIQDASPGMGEISSDVWLQFLSTKPLQRNKRIAVLLHSPGGYADAAYRLAQLFRLNCGGYTVVVPIYAKSAATLFALGADKMILGPYAELGPLDAQMDDLDRERRISALEVTQAVERLNSEAMKAVDAQMILWARRSGKKIDTLLPIATHFVAEMMRPMFDKIDTVHYTKMARVLKVAQDYATRLLLSRGMEESDAEGLAEYLTQAYSEHGFVIDAGELCRIGLRVERAKDDVETILASLAVPLFSDLDGNYLGTLEAKHASKANKEESTSGAGTQRNGRGKRNRKVQVGPPDALGEDDGSGSAGQPVGNGNGKARQNGVIRRRSRLTLFQKPNDFF